MRRIRHIAATLLLLAAAATAALAQNRVVSGTVLDTGRQPLIGAAVMLAGTTTGDVTAPDGTFSLRVPSEEVTLEVSCLGYVSQTVRVPAGQQTVNVILEEDNMLLQETVVVGYGVQKKVNLTGAVTAVDTKELEDRTTHNLTNMLQGAVPGLNISTSAGNPGSSGSLNIRGITSINAADPLVLVDGVEADMSRVNANDVESISVIKDASAAAIYGARAAYGVILITTKTGSDKGGKATVRYSGRMGWEEPTVSTDFETRGYWSVYTVDKFWATDAGKNYTTYTEHDMAELLARVNDVTENPERPWVVEEYRNGRKQWVYYCNTDWYHELYNDRHPVQQHSVSVTGGNKDVKYFLSGAYDRQSGIIKLNPDVFRKYNLRAKVDARLNKFMQLSNNTSFYSSGYDYPGGSSVQDSFAYASRHALASFPLQNPDGSWVYGTPLISGNYNVANGRHLVFGENKHRNQQLRTDFTNTTELKITPTRHFTLTANYTYRIYQSRNQYRSVNFKFRRYPDADYEYYTTGAGEDSLEETISTSKRHAANVFGTYDNTFADAHHLTVTAGMNMEDWSSKSVGALGRNLLSETLNDLDLVGPDETGNVLTEVSGGQNEYAIMGYFGRINYDYKERYLLEVSGRYDGTSRFKKGHQWGFFPSASVGWRISEEPFLKGKTRWLDNLKLRFSYGNLGNQVVRTSGGGQNYYAYLRQISVNDFAGYSFGEGTTMGKYSTLGAPVDANLTWETAEQYNLGLDFAAFRNRLTFTGEIYRRNTLNMLTAGPDIPAVFGAGSPQTNAADLKTEGYELSLGWRNQVSFLGHPFGYSLRGTLSDYRSYITRFNNPTKSLAMSYYEGQRIGEIWGFEVDGLFKSDEEAKQYTSEVVDCSYINSRMTGGFLAGDLRFVDLDDNHVLGIGSNTVSDPGDRKILGNSLASLQYGFTLSADWLGFDVTAFFQGTGNHYWYPAGMNYMFWGPYSYPYVSFLQRDFIDRVWSEENPDTYFPRPRAYSSTGGELSKVNSRYLQNIRYLRFKNLTVGYTLPSKLTRKVGLEKARVYFSGENLAYWSPLAEYTKYLDPESAYRRNTSESAAQDHMSYPWQKTLMFGLDITF
ncbi:MAG: TonB-dependent receptor [Bacteroidales bacterium]|nr:TonB-dependent receptor [Bacteroidales bacterium]